MKKILIALMTICLIITLCISLTSCGHKCEFSTDWSKDANDHWHACIGEECVEIADKAAHNFDNACDTECNTCGFTRTTEHVWNEGEITTEPSQVQDGIKTFTCTVCQETKTESVPFTGLSKEVWNSAFTAIAMKNFTYVEVAETTAMGTTSTSSTTYKFTNDAAWVKMVVAGEAEEYNFTNKAEVDELRDRLIVSLKDLSWHNKYEYDAQTKSYKAKVPVKIDALDASTSDITIKFNNDNKLAEIKYSVEFEMMGIEFTATSIVTISDYGTTTIS